MITHFPSRLLAQLQDEGLLVATNNGHKLSEFRRILGPLGIEVVSPSELGLHLEVEETAPDFAGNACLKAQEGFRLSQRPCLADDSGLCVPSLNGEPGVRSARYGGPGLDDEGRIRHLLRNMSELSDDDRKAYFACVLALITSKEQSKCLYFEGRAYGRIARRMQGNGGFGYDPVFLDEASGKSFAELSAREKDERSHRGKAIQKLLSFLQESGARHRDPLKPSP